MSIDYRETTLWTAAFGATAVRNRREKDARNGLLVALRKLEERISPLLAKVDASCQDLTMHDISHVHQLWSVASEICGPDYPLNSLEGFVLGAAFLIHDAGLTASAYPGGLPGLRRTSYYRDRLAALLRVAADDAPDEKLLEKPRDDIAQRALFDTLRAIHAKRAETLLDQTSPHPLTGHPYPLFPEADLFFDCGEVIGLVAASHHWDIDTVHERFREPRTPPAAFPGWYIDAAKLACILRTADACAIDERRARIMPFLLLNPSGVSRDHWKFQAYLNPGVRQDDAILFQSKRPFPRQDMTAWWVAYDSICIADRELRDCARLLRDRAISGRHYGLKPFAVRRVAGAGEPTRLKEFVEVLGWMPVNTAIRIDNPISLIEKLGGWHLYGSDYSAPLREMLQNAADAIRVRRRLPHGYDDTSPYPGRIDVQFECSEQNGAINNLTMTIADDGAGMCAEVMTGTLLDFGRSFWGSEEAARLYPGLLSDPFFQPTGKFGIGFYSIFMIADDVKVISRPWQTGTPNAKVLHFQNGVRGRAEFRDYSEDEDEYLSSKHSTSIKAKIKYSRWLSFLTTLSRITRASFLPVGQSEPAASLDELWKEVEHVAKELVFPLDVECWMSYPNSPPRKLNNPGVLELPTHEFAQHFNEIFGSPDDAFPKRFLPEEIPLIDGISDNQGRVHTRGCISTEIGRGFWHIGGFLSFGVVGNLVKGLRAGRPITASRSMLSSLASEQELRRWGERQLERVVNSSLDLKLQMVSIANLCSIDVDIRQHAMVVADENSRTVEDIVNTLGSDARIFVAGQRMVQRSRNAVFVLDQSVFPGFGLKDLEDLKHDLRIAARGGVNDEAYGEIKGSLEAPSNQNSAYGALLQALKDAGYRTTVEPPGEYLIGIYNGPQGGRGYLLLPRLMPGSEFKRYGLVVCARRDPDLI